jgi:hypothetical protein
MRSSHGQVIRRGLIFAILGALILATVALAARTTYYDGTTSQKLGGRRTVINLSVSHNKLTNVDLPAVFPDCQNTYQPFNTFGTRSFHGFAMHHGKFSGSVTFRVETLKKTLKITGRLKGRQVSGTLSVTYGSCKTGRVTYKAKKAGGPSL